MKKSRKGMITFFVCLAALVLLLFLLPGSNGTEISYSELLDKIESGEIANVFISGDYTVYVRNTGSQIDVARFPSKYDNFAYVPDRNAEEIYTAIKALEAANGNAPSVTYDNPARYSTLISIGIPLLSVGLLILVFYFIYRQSQNSNSTAMNFGKTKSLVNHNIKVRFSDVAGAEEEKEELKEVVEFLKTPRKFTAVGARVPKGILLVGPPGTGKTLFAKAVAGEAGVPFFSISGSDFVEMFVGVGASRVRDLFEQAKKNMPCIIFIDEIDAVGRQRGAGLGGGHDEREQTLNQLLVHMDGFEPNDGIIVMAATNRADILDPALLRPGRFDRQIYVSPPDVKGREAIFKVHARNKPISSEINFKNLARLTTGFTGADIENLLNEAAILAARANRTTIISEDIHEAIDKVISGPAKKSRLVTETDKRITAYHESGHAIVAKSLKHCNNVHEVTIIPRGQAGGYTFTRPDNDDVYESKNTLIAAITMMLGGRAAEEIVLKDITTGASNDIQRASAVAKSMVTEWGMSALGNIFLGSDHEVFLGRDFGTSHTMSEEMAGRVDLEIEKIIGDAYKNALEILNNHREILDNMVRVLYAKETIYGDEVDMIMEGKSPEEVIAYMEKKDAEKSVYKRTSPINDLLVPEPKTALDKVADELRSQKAQTKEESKSEIDISNDKSDQQTDEFEEIAKDNSSASTAKPMDNEPDNKD